MPEAALAPKSTIRPLHAMLQEIRSAVEQGRLAKTNGGQNIRDLRWQFDQVSAVMNQAIYNDDPVKVHPACLQTIVALVEIMSRS